MKCPCIDCIPPKRKIGCHSRCEEYKKWCDQEEKRKKEEKRDLGFTLSHSAIRSIWKTIGRKK